MSQNSRPGIHGTIYAFCALTASKEVADDIYHHQGVAWAVTYNLLGWLLGKTSVIEFMHVVYLGKQLCFNPDWYHMLMLSVHRDGQIFDQEYSLQNWHVQLTMTK